MPAPTRSVSWMSAAMVMTALAFGDDASATEPGAPTTSVAVEPGGDAAANALAREASTTDASSLETSAPHARAESFLCAAETPRPVLPASHALAPFSLRPHLPESSTVHRFVSRLHGTVDLLPHLKVGPNWTDPLDQSRSATSAGEVHALAQLIAEHGLLPSISIEGVVFPETPEHAAHGEVGARVSKRVGTWQMHFDASFEPEHGAENKYLLGIATDHAIGRALLVVGDAYLEHDLHGPHHIWVGEVGLAGQLSRHLRLFGTIGAEELDGVRHPRFVVGFSAG